MISIYLGQLLKSNTIIIKGSLKRFRDFIYIDDVIKIIDLCSSRKITKNKIYNISTGYKTSVKEILSLISQITKKKNQTCSKRVNPWGSVWNLC